MARMSERVLYVGDYNLSSWSLRPYLALHASGLPFRAEVIRLNQPDTAAKIAAVSPTHKVPCLHEGELAITESLAICEYVAELAPQLWPEDRFARAMARAAATEMHAGFANLRREHPMHLAERLPKQPNAEVVRELARIEALFAASRARFGEGGPFLFGRFSIADCMFAPVATRMRTYELPVGPASTAFQEAIFAHPSFLAWEALAQREIGA